MKREQGDPENLERDRRADRLLAKALERPDTERTAFVERACAGDDDLRARVLRLLRMAEADDHELATGAILRDGLAEELFGEKDTDATGRCIGPYRLLDPLGRGGSATVYLAERADGEFEHRVAIKVLRATDDVAAGVVRRFGQERQILAALNHPSIAALLDGGTTEWGRPFLVVEHVDGQAIDAFCDARRASVRQRLELFLEVVGAVQHAHQHLVVHRDIKPSNILVTEEGRAKLLDFGIAKLLDPEHSAATTPETRTAALWLTPRYASPEQLLGEPITTASDVYQLGALLYELIARRPAFDTPATSPAALVAAARERAPAQPSLVTNVPDDLDAIVMTATRPEPERRYASVALLADDVLAFLDRRPVRARGDSLAYRARRFAGRHRVGVAVTLVFAVAVVGFAAAITWGFVNAERERKRAESIGAFLKDTLRGAQPYVSRGRDPALLLAVLEDAAGRVETELADQPFAAADVRLTISETFRSLADFPQAELHANAAAEAFGDRLGPDARETLYARQLLGLTYWDQGRNEEAERVLEDVYTRALRSLGPHDDITVLTVSSLGLAVRAQGRLADAEPLYRSGMELALGSLGPSSAHTIGTIGNLAFLLAELDRLEEAEPFARQAVELSREHLGMENPDTFLSIDKLASLVGQRNRLEEAFDLHREAYAGLLRVLGERHSTTLGSAYSTAIVLRRLGRYDESIKTLQTMLPFVREEYGPESRFMFPTLNELGKSLLADGRPTEALPHLKEACAVAEKRLTREHYLYAVMTVHLADALIETGSTRRAEGLLRDARQVLEETFGADGEHRHFEDLVRVEEKLPAS